MKKIISLLLLVGAVSANAASLELKVKQQKTLPNGNAYGLESGIYFELTDLAFNLNAAAKSFLASA